MPRYCIVPRCPGNGSLFGVPSTPELFSLWEQNIPGGRGFLKKGHEVCESHFQKELIVRKKSVFDKDGKEMSSEPLTKPHLVYGAVPTIFPKAKNDDIDDICDDVETSLVPFQEIVLSSDDRVTQNINADGVQKKDASQNEIQEDIGEISRFSSGDKKDSIPENEKIYIDLKEVKKEFEAHILPSWSVTEAAFGNETFLIFNYAKLTKDAENRIYPYTQRTILLSKEGRLHYFFKGKRLCNVAVNLIGFVNRNFNVFKTLKDFEFKSACQGIDKVNTDFLPAFKAIQDSTGKWRDKDCFGISSSKRCKMCNNLKLRVSQTEKRAKEVPKNVNISSVTDPILKSKFEVYRNRLHQERNKRYKLQCEVEKLKESLSKAKEELANISQESLHDLCKKYQIPEAQRNCLIEILNAASKKSPNGRRYSSEWIMQCLLMNLRSSSYYNYLRSNNILPLPSPKTMRDYFSLIDLKCGFDPQFHEVLKKHFEKKSLRERHGIITLDEVNLRKSVKVNAKDLTYIGMTDLGEESENINKDVTFEDQATKGLVLMFQPLFANYSQPFGVFASKNPVKGEDLAKILIKAIVYLETSGALIHGVNGDGASTNNKMFTTFGIKTGIGDVQSSFEHPLDPDRRVFAFSDMPHVVKNIRNRLYNKKTLRVNATKEAIQWRHFQLLFKYDTENINHIRMCPKISHRHIYLDNTAKMRVNLSIQMLSHSTATGLEYYSNQHCEGLADCQETINFCEMVNDLFDALNIKNPHRGLTKDSPEYQVLQKSLEWLDAWEREFLAKRIPEEEFLTRVTSSNLRLTLQSNLDFCDYMISKYEVPYILTGKINQDNLEKFFGIIRQAGGSNDHPDCATFLQLYKVLSIYSLIKPPKYGNCTVNKNETFKPLINLEELQQIFKKKPSVYKSEMEKMKNKLDEILQSEDKEVEEVFEFPMSKDHNYGFNEEKGKKTDSIAALNDHDYCLSPVFDSIIYYATGYLCKQLMKKYGNCEACVKGILKNESDPQNPQGFEHLVDLKSKGKLIHSNYELFYLIKRTEQEFGNFARHKEAFILTTEAVLSDYDFHFPCKTHGADVLAHAICYYTRMRMLQFAFQENASQKKEFTKKNKLSKLTQQ